MGGRWYFLPGAVTIHVKCSEQCPASRSSARTTDPRCHLQMHFARPRSHATAARGSPNQRELRTSSSGHGAAHRPRQQTVNPRGFHFSSHKYKCKTIPSLTFKITDRGKARGTEHDREGSCRCRGPGKLGAGGREGGVSRTPGAWRDGAPRARGGGRRTPQGGRRPSAEPAGVWGGSAPLSPRPCTPRNQLEP